MSDKTAIPAEHFYAQFHHADAPHHHSVNHPTREWWDLHDDVPGEMISEPVRYARGGTVEKKKQHPALSIPGVHIRTAEAGEPTFDYEEPR